MEFTNAFWLALEYWFKSVGHTQKRPEEELAFKNQSSKKERGEKKT